MPLDLWLAFVVAAGLVLVIPGPTILLVVGHALAHGRSSVLPLTVGVALGDLLAMTLSLAGLGSLLLASAQLFTLVKLAGAAYLVWLGIGLWRSDARGAKPAPTGTTAGRPLRSALLVTASNPKSIIFFIAFLPQFVRHDGHELRQLLVLGSTFLLLAILNAALYALFASRLQSSLANGRGGRLFRRAGGSALIGAGLVTATLQRSA